MNTQENTPHQATTGVDEAAKAYAKKCKPLPIHSMDDAIDYDNRVNAFKAGAFFQAGKPTKTLEECKNEERMYALLDKDISSAMSGYGKKDGTQETSVDYNKGHRDSWIKGFKAAELYATQKPQTHEGWVSVKDRLPDTEGSYLCGKQYFHSKAFIQCVYDFKLSRMRDTGELYIDEDGVTGHFLDGLGYGQDVTHWQKLPPPPTNEQKQ